MILTVKGSLNPYYLQQICMLFYPGAKFSENEPLTEASDVAVFTRTDSKEGVKVTCSFSSGGCLAEASAVRRPEEVHGMTTDPGADPIEKAAKVAAGIAALEAGRELFGFIPSWGILTGIRPAKLASELLNAHSPDGVRLYTPNDTRAILNEEFLVNPRKASLAVDIAKNEQKIARLARSYKQPTCSVYISIPFCPSRCAYCSFVSYTSPRLLSLVPDYLERLCRDITQTFSYIRSRGFKVLTVYIGGGTPTTLNEKQLELLLKTINEAVDVSRLAEFTLEAGRPDTVTAEKLAIAYANGVTRISVNPQTMSDTILENIGRRHTVADFLRAYEIARNSGIKIINADLIAGLPGDHYATFSKSLDGVIALDPENITVHTFCVKKSAEILKVDTEIYSRSADETVKGIDYSQVRLKNAGYQPYYIYRQKNSVGNLENVGFAKKGTEGLYNVLMMEEMHTIFAIGAGSATKYVKTDEDGKKQIKRVFAPKYPYEYLAEDENVTVTGREKLADAFFGFTENEQQ